MRLIKTLGLVAIAVVVMVTVEVGSAMATQLEEVVWCKTRTQACPANFPAGTKILAAATNAEFLSTLGNVSCFQSELQMTNTSVLVHGNVTALVFGGECKLETGEKCKVSSENLEYLFKGALVTDAANSKYEIKFIEKSPNGLPEITLECGMVIDCTYAAKEVSIEAKLAFEPERLVVSQQFLFSEGTFCSKVMTWDATYNTECREKEGSEFKFCWVKMEG